MGVGWENAYGPIERGLNLGDSLLANEKTRRVGPSCLRSNFHPRNKRKESDSLNTQNYSKFGKTGERLTVFMISGFMICALNDFGCDRWRVFKSERKKQRGLVLTTHEIENH